MRVEVYVPFLICAAVAPGAGIAARRLPPRPAAWILTATAAVGALAWCAMLVLLAVSGLGRWRALAHVGHYWSARAFQTLDPVAVPVASFAAVLLVTTLVALARRSVLHARALSEGRAAARAAGADGLIVVDDPKPYALALPGSGGAIVASTCLLQILSARERRAVLAHERAHLAGRHHLFLSVLTLAAAANPLLRPVRSAGSLALERWADEAAAQAIGDRRALARALSKTALADHASTFGLALGGHDVPFRVRALIGPPPRRRPGLLLAALMPLALILACSAEAGHDLGHLFGTAATHRPTQIR